MADQKQGPGFVDQHIEKVVLGVSLIILIYSVVTFGISTPRRLEVDAGPVRNEEVPPGQVDATLLEAAEAIESRIKDADFEQPDLPDYREYLVAIQNTPLPSLPFRLNYGVAMGVGLVDPVPEQQFAPPLEELAQAMPQPMPPLLWGGQEVTFVPTADTATRTVRGPDSEAREKVMLRMVDAYPWRQLRGTWSRQLAGTIIPAYLVALGYEVQIERLGPDGNWVAVDNSSFQRYPGGGAELAFLPEPAIPEYTGENDQAVQAAVAQYRSKYMLSVLQPTYYDVWTSFGREPWSVNLPWETLRDNPDWSGLFSEPEGGTVAAAEEPARTTRASRTSPPPDMPMIMPGMGEAPAPTRTRPAASATTAAARTQPLPDLPDPQRQIEVGKMLAWYHFDDARSGATYRARIRWVFANPLLSYDEYLAPDRQEDAKPLMVRSPWSEWSPPLRIDQPIEFFLTYANSSTGQVSVAIFKKILGQWTMTTASNLSPGQEIRDSDSVTVTDPATQQNKELPGQDFDTGAVVVEVNFSEAAGIGALASGEQAELVYLDSQGQLRRRLYSWDKQSPRYDELKELARRETERPRPEDERETRDRRDRRDRRERDGRGEPGPGPGGGPGPIIFP